MVQGLACALRISERNINRAAGPEDNSMLNYAILFLIISLIAGLLGFGGIAAGAATMAKIVFWLFLVLFVVSLITPIGRRSIW